MAVGTTHRLSSGYSCRFLTYVKVLKTFEIRGIRVDQLIEY